MRKRILGIDYGSKRLGIAVSDPLNIIARGVAVVDNSPRMLDEIEKIAREFDVDTIVVGMPFNLKGEKGAKAQEAGAFLEKLAGRLKVEVIASDERFTTCEAQRTLLARFPFAFEEV